MPPASHAKLVDLLSQDLAFHKSRAECFAAAVLCAIENKSVHLADMVAHLPGEAKPESKFRRFQIFFGEFNPDYADIARLNLEVLRTVIGEKPLVIAMDRTNWEARENDVNLLVMSVCLGDAGQPLLWTDIRHAGNSDTRKRIRMGRRLLNLIGVDRIQCLLGDREFVGADWFAWMLKEKVPFAMRLRENMKTTPEGGSLRDAAEHFATLLPGQWKDLGVCRVCGVTMGVCGVRLADGELLILGYSGVSGSEAKDFFMRRWNIETGFQKLKSHGFNLESSRLFGGGKFERLMAVLSVAFAWCYAMGVWSVEEAGRPIRIIHRLKRRAESIFRRGRETLAGVFRKSIRHIRSTSRKAFSLLRAACRVARHNDPALI